MALHLVAEASSPRPHTERALAAMAPTLAGVQRLGVAFSGGVDSGVLTALAAQILGRDAVIACLGVSPGLATDDRTVAHEVARSIGVRVVEVATREGAIPAYVANGPDRCFHCKDELFTRIAAEVVPTERLDAIAYGENADDTRRLDRPGSRAARRHRVLRPLAVAGLTKADVRAVAHELALPCADKPATPCLASRIPHHEPVTPTKMLQIERAEQALRRLGFRDGRVHHHGEIARVELLPDELLRAVASPVREELADALRAAGFRFVTLDLRGMPSDAPHLSVVDTAE